MVSVEIILGLLTVATLHVITALPFGPVIVNQRSTFNNQQALLAIDGDRTTCSGTGFQQAPWWKLDLGTPVAVSGLDILGSAAAFQILVGNQSDSLGLMDGTSSNSVCSLVYGISMVQSTRHDCSHQLYGRYVSIKVIDPIPFDQLKLCEVSLY